MSKLYLNTLDKKMDFEYNKAHIFTEHYKVKIKKNELHSPLAARAIFESNNRIYSFIVKQPIIKVDYKGDIHIWTPSRFEDASHEKHQKATKLEEYNAKKKLRLLKNKSQMGLTPEEIAEFIESESELEIIKLKNKKINPMIGGGF